MKHWPIIGRLIISA